MPSEGTSDIARMNPDLPYASRAFIWQRRERPCCRSTRDISVSDASSARIHLQGRSQLKRSIDEIEILLRKA